MFLLTLLVISSCSSGPAPVAQLKHFPVDDMSGVLTANNVELDPASSTDGGGSLRVSVDGPAVVELFAVENLDIDDVMLIYQAQLRTEDVAGQVYLEMWCDFEGLGEYFSRGLQSPLSGSNDWSTASTPFLLKEGQCPSRVRLNLVIDGAGTAWIDDIRLLTSSLS